MKIFKNTNIWKLTKKYILVIEFIISIITIYSLYQTVLFKNYNNIWPLKYLAFFIPGIIIICLIIFLNFKKNKDSVEKIIISFLIPIGMLYVFFIPPSYVPDEHSHIARAYEISNGKFVTEISEDGSSKAMIPKFFIENRIAKISKYGQFNDALYKTTDYTDIEESENPAQAYPAILYIFSSIAFFIGRIFQLNPILTMYFAKILNFMVFLFLGYYSIKIIPFGKKVIGVILFLPMVLQQGASISADSILNSISVFYIAFTLYLCKKKNTINIKQQILYMALSFFIGISKIVYVPIVGLSLLFVGLKKFKKRNKLIFITVNILITLFISVGYFIFMQRYETVDAQKVYLETNNVNMSEQINAIINNPKNIIFATKNSIWDGMYLDTLIGSALGWLNIGTPRIMTYIFIMLLVLTPFLDKNKIELNKVEKIWLMLIALGVYLLIILAMYLTWTKVGNIYVEGIQGRYFIPIISLPLLCLIKKGRYIEFKNINFTLAVVTSFLNIITIQEVIKFFL